MESRIFILERVNGVDDLVAQKEIEYTKILQVKSSG